MSSRDEYDSVDATYLIALDEHGEHAGSMRLLPTTCPHILGELFPQLCDNEVPRGRSIFEITRLCLPSRHGATHRLAIRNRLISAMIDHALTLEITSLTGVVKETFRAKVLEMGWRCRPLGPAVRENGSLLGAFQIDVEPETSQLLSVRGIYVSNTTGMCEPAREAA